MKKKMITIVDYGVGNIFSVRQAFEHCGADVELTSDKDVIAKAEALIVPGVGAFGDGMAALRERGLVVPIREYAKTGRPLMGICLGMQFLFNHSEEFGHHEGLGLIPGVVREIPRVNREGKSIKVPHIGWSPLSPGEKGPDWKTTAMARIEKGSAFYFVHSFAAYPEDPAVLLGEAEYEGLKITAAVKYKSVYGFQFHPERSGELGLDIIREFLTEISEK